VGFPRPVFLPSSCCARCSSGKILVLQWGRQGAQLGTWRTRPSVFGKKGHTFCGVFSHSYRCRAATGGDLLSAGAPSSDGRFLEHLEGANQPACIRWKIPAHRLASVGMTLAIRRCCYLCCACPLHPASRARTANPRNRTGARPGASKVFISTGQHGTIGARHFRAEKWFAQFEPRERGKKAERRHLWWKTRVPVRGGKPATIHATQRRHTGKFWKTGKSFAGKATHLAPC